jgi:hypothetical protein
MNPASMTAAREPGIENPYESGAAPTLEVVKRLHWATAASITFAVISFLGLAALIGYIVWANPRIGNFEPNPAFIEATVIAWGLGSVLGVVAAVFGLYRGHERRALALFCLLANLMLALTLSGLLVLGWVASHK